MSTANDILADEIEKAAAPRPLLNRKAVRALLLHEYANWGRARTRHRVAKATLDEIMDHLHTSVTRFIIGQASQGFPGRQGGARVCQRERRGGPHEADSQR